MNETTANYSVTYSIIRTQFVASAKAYRECSIYDGNNQ